MKRVAMLLVLASTACVTTQLTSGGEGVRLTANSAVVEACDFVGAVEGEDRMNGGIAGQGAAEENANRRIRNNAADMGANVVMIVTSNIGPSGAIIRGEAYRCG